MTGLKVVLHYLSRTALSITGKVEECISEVQQWLSQNMLKLNAGKTEIKLFGSAIQLAKLDLQFIKVGTETVPIQNEPVRNLGVVFDTNMRMSAQVKSMTRSCNFQLAKLRKIRRLLTSESIEMMVRNLVITRLDYCNALLYGITADLIRRLQLIQNSAARLITGTPKHAHITQDLIRLHWLPIKQRIAFKIIVLTYKALHGMAPPYISQMLTPYNPSRTLRSASKSLLSEFCPKCVTFGGRAFSRAAPTLWNSLPEYVLTSPTVDIDPKSAD